MDQVTAFFGQVWSALTGAFNAPVMNGQALSDLLTLEFLISLLGDVLAAIVILIIGYTIAGWISRRIRGIGQRRSDLDGTLFNFLGTLSRYVIMAFALLFVLNTFGVQTTSLVALIGAAGLAIGLALQGTLTNIAAGVMMILFRPIKEGDFVEVNGQMGTVKEISLNFVELASIGNVQIIVPNSEVWGNTIVNYSSYPTRRAEWTFGVSYDAHLEQAENVIRDTITADSRTDTSQDLFCKVNNLGDSSVDFLTRAWVSADDYFAYQADMKRAVKEALDNAGIGIPYPTRSLEIVGLERSGGSDADEDTGERRRDRKTAPAGEDDSLTDEDEDAD